jgi:hypothetical protein
MRSVVGPGDDSALKCVCDSTISSLPFESNAKPIGVAISGSDAISASL